MAFLNKKIKTLLFITGLIFIVALVYHSRGTFSSLIVAADWGGIAASIVAGLASTFMMALLYSTLLQKYNIRIKYIHACKIFIYSQITKYIPGKIWSIWYQTTHLTSRHSTASVLFSNIDLMVISVLTITGISAFMITLGNNYAVALFGWLAMLIIGTIIARNCHHFSLVARFIGHYEIINKHLCECHTLDKWISIFIMLVAFSMLYAFSYIVMLRAAFDMSTNDAMIFTGFLGLSWIFGVVTIISPSGMGTRELFFILVARAFETDVAVETISAIAVFSRGWLVTQDIFGAAILRIYLLGTEKSNPR